MDWNENSRSPLIVSPPKSQDILLLYVEKLGVLGNPLATFLALRCKLSFSGLPSSILPFLQIWFLLKKFSFFKHLLLKSAWVCRERKAIGGDAKKLKCCEDKSCGKSERDKCTERWVVGKILNVHNVEVCCEVLTTKYYVSVRLTL